MVCKHPSEATPGLWIAYTNDEPQKGTRPAPGPFWASPDIRLALLNDKGEVADPDLLDPGKWRSKPWDGQVQVGDRYKLLVRMRNTDTREERRSINLQSWVAVPGPNGVGPGSDVRLFTSEGFEYGPLPTGTADPEDPARMLIIKSNQYFEPTQPQLEDTGGHVCAAVNVFADADSACDLAGTPQDGFRLEAVDFVDPTCDRRHGQCNIMIVPRPAGTRETRRLTVAVPATDRCPLHAVVALRRVELPAPEGTLTHVPEINLAATRHGIGHPHPPGHDPFDGIGIGRGGPSRDKRVRVNLDPGERADLTLTLGPARGEKPGDAFAFDAITTDTDTDQVWGGQRVFVLVTERGG